MGAAHDGQPDHIDVLLDGYPYDLIDRLVKPGIDHLHSRFLQCVGNHFCPPVMSVQTRLRY